MAKNFDTLEDSNPTSRPSIHDLSSPARRRWVQGGLGAALAGALGGLAGCAGRAGAAADGTAAAQGAAAADPAVAAAARSTRLGFVGVPASRADTVVVPEGYVAQVLAPWGEPVGVPGQMPAWKPDASNTAAEQALQMGMHHDGIHFFPLDGSARHGLLVMNHEYTDPGLLHPGGATPLTAEKVAKDQAAHGISVIEVQQGADGWQVVRPSRWARRLTSRTPCALAGPAAGHPRLCTAADPAGRTVLGTLNNCASGRTPWGTYLSGEENWAGYFDGGDAITADQKRWGLQPRGWSGWARHDPRFDAARHPNEFHRFGWVVEVDPMDPASTPVKRTALGRAAHEGAWVALTADGRAVVYSGEDARFEYLYKFVSRDRMATPAPGQSAAQANRTLLDHGTLHVARFDADGTGRWLPLVHGQGPLTAAHGFADQAEVLIHARQAADALGATRMDRPEWLAIDPQRREVYCTLTNNTARGAPGQPGPDAANPRANNTMGQIIRWQEDVDFDGLTMRWSHLLLAGDPANTRAEARGNVQGDAFGSPDGLLFDPRGVLWIETDASTRQMHSGDYTRLGNNQMLACDLATGEVRRFLTGPVGCEITGATLTPDARTLFINVQHPGEPGNDVTDPADPTRHSRWPDGPAAGRPRSATLAIRRLDGGVIGA